MVECAPIVPGADVMASKMRRGARAAAFLALLLLEASALAQTADLPLLRGSAPELGGFDASAGVPMHDDGTGGDAVAGDGVYTARVEIAVATALDYEVVPLGAGLSDAVGGANHEPVHLTFPDAGPHTIEFRYSDNGGTDLLPARSVADSWTTGFSLDPALRRPVDFVVVGALQAHFGAAAFDPSGAATLLRDDGRLADAEAGDGIATVALATAAGLGDGEHEWKIAARGAGSGVRLGADGFALAPQDAASFTADEAPFVPLRFELDLLRGAARVGADPSLFRTPLLSEIVRAPSDAEMIELYNPAPVVLSLDGLYLTDAPEYWRLPGTPTTPGAYDFDAAFPAGAWIAPRGFRTVAVRGPGPFETSYGLAPDYALVGGDASVPAMRPAYTGAIGGSAGLTDGGEFAALFSFTGGGLVEDLDLVVFGSPTAANAPALKTDLVPVAGGPAYGEDLGSVLSSTAPGTERTARRDFEPSERFSACAGPCPVSGSASGVYNGVYDPARGGRADETSEALATTWYAEAQATPGAANDATYHLEGRVETDAGASAAGARISARQEGATLETTSDADGAFAFDGLSFGDVELEASRVGWTPAARSTFVDRDGALDAPLVLARIGAGLVVAGVVEDTSGAPLEGAIVVLDDGSAPPRSTVSDADGAFAFADVAADHACSLGASRDGYLDATTSLEVAEVDVTDLVLSLSPAPPTFAVRGTVVEASDGAPIAGAVVRVDGLGLSATSGADGAFALDAVPEGTYTLTATAPGHALHTEALTVAGADVDDLVVTLSPPASELTLSGIVRDAGSHAPLAGATVILVPAGSLSRTVVTDETGHYLFTGLDAVHCDLTASADGFAPRTASIDLAGDLVLDLDLDPRGDGTVSLSGHVALPDGSDAAGVSVDLVGPATGHATSDGAGTYRVDGLATGVYRVTVTLDGYFPQVITLHLDADTVQDFALVPRGPQGTVSGGCACSASTGGPTPLFPLLLALGLLARLSRSRRRGSRGS